MKNSLLILLIAGVFFTSCQTQQANEISASYELIERIIPGYSNQFLLEKLESNKDVFEIDALKEKVVLRGNNPVSIASALNHYLKYHCNAHLSWCGDQLNLPEKLPVPSAKYSKTIEQKYRVNFNYCTYSYSMPFWNWERWEREIDFMALNGINMPLSIVGLEGVWYNTLMRLNFTDEEARAYLVGPAFFAWQWMTNIHTHAGPLPKSWIDKHIVLGKKIMQRQVELGMKPIQQSFTGSVPGTMKEKFPQASILKERDWVKSFDGTYQLDPLDPLFKKIGRVFFEEQKKLFGAHHYYAADPFHEGTPPKEGEAYLNNVGKAIIDLMLENDTLSTCMMQSWSIRKDIASAIAKDKLIILELSGGRAIRNDYFWGYDCVIGNLHNFGGRTNLHGDLKMLAANKYLDFKEKAPAAVGTGFFMEGIVQNPIYYDLAYEMGTSSDSIDIEQWLDNYCVRRYGALSDNAQKASKILLNTAYKEGTNGVEKGSIICARPAVDVKKTGPNAKFHIPYDNKDLLRAVQLLIGEENLLKKADPYRYDVVDLLRQVLTNYGQTVQKRASQAFKNKDITDFRKYSQEFLTLLKDVDRLLSTREEFSFEKWANDARSWGDTEEEKDLYEYNASMLITLWGPLSDSREPMIFDYAWREWSGLIESYYYPRWEKFFDMLDTHLENGTEYIEDGLPLTHGREAFRANEFYSQLADWEIGWVKSKHTFDTCTKDDELEVSKELYEKYSTRIKNGVDLRSKDTEAFKYHTDFTDL